MEIQWFPGHMEKARKLLIANLKEVDAVIELLDARIPFSSKNPLLDSLIGNKPRVTVLNKHDLADSNVSRLWLKWYSGRGIKCVFLNSVSGEGLEYLKEEIRASTAQKTAAALNKGIRNYRVKAIVVGIPNVGKSSLINRVAGKKSAKTGNRPGITRGKQWIRLAKDIDLLDMPGILWPKFHDRAVGINLAATGAIREEVVDRVDLASELLIYLIGNYPDLLISRYKLKDISADGRQMLEDIGRNRGCMMSGGVIDIDRAASIVLDEFRKGTIGRISLEKPEDPHVILE